MQRIAFTMKIKPGSEEEYRLLMTQSSMTKTAMLDLSS